MINAKELRIGNAVYGFKTIWTIQRQDFNTITFDEQDNECLPFEAIAITRELLEKFGFSGADYGMGCGYEATMLWKGLKVHWVYGYLRLWKIDGFQMDCRCVHQLQNVHFALTGEELEIKL